MKEKFEQILPLISKLKLLLDHEQYAASPNVSNLSEFNLIISEINNFLYYYSKVFKKNIICIISMSRRSILMKSDS